MRLEDEIEHHIADLTQWRMTDTGFDDTSPREKAVRRLKAMGREAVPVLTRWLKVLLRGDEQEVSALLGLDRRTMPLGFIGIDREGYGLLKSGIVEALSGSQDRIVFEVLCDAVKDPSCTGEAAPAIARFADRRAVPHLLDVFSIYAKSGRTMQDTYSLLEEALMACGAEPHTIARRAKIEAEPKARTQLTKAFAAMCGRNELPDLLDLLENSSCVGAAATGSLVRILRLSSGSADERLVREVVNMATRREHALRWRVFSALAKASLPRNEVILAIVAHPAVHTAIVEAVVDLGPKPEGFDSDTCDRVEVAIKLAALDEDTSRKREVLLKLTEAKSRGCLEEFRFVTGSLLMRSNEPAVLLATLDLISALDSLEQIAHSKYEGVCLGDLSYTRVFDIVDLLSRMQLLLNKTDASVSEKTAAVLKNGNLLFELAFCRGPAPDRNYRPIRRAAREIMLSIAEGDFATSFRDWSRHGSLWTRLRCRRLGKRLRDAASSRAHP